MELQTLLDDVVSKESEKSTADNDLATKDNELAAAQTARDNAATVATTKNNNYLTSLTVLREAIDAKIDSASTLA